MAARKIVVRDRPYRWALTPSDDGLRIVVRSEARAGGKLFAWFAHAVLVTPYVVRVAIERALDDGWIPMGTANATVRFEEPIPDRSVAVEPPIPLDRRELALLDRVYDSTEDRLVYADWLLERGDPQGELIALSCLDRPLTESETARRIELEAERARWLGPVAALAHRAIWRDGLLESCVLARAGSGVVDASLGHRGWRTVRELEASGGNLALPDLVRLVTQPALHCMRGLSVSVALALELAHAPWEHPRIEAVAALHGRGRPTAAMIAALCARLPALRKLALPTIGRQRFPAILAACTARSLVFTNPAGLRHADQLGDHRALTEIVCALGWAGFASLGPTAVLRRGADGNWSQLTLGPGELARQTADELLEELARLPPDSLIDVRCDPKLRLYNDPQLIKKIAAALVAQPRARL